MTRRGVFPFLILTLLLGVIAHGAELKNDRWRITIDEKTLETRATTADGLLVTLSAPSGDWSHGDVNVAYTLNDEELRFTFTASKEGSCTWPIVDVAAPAKALILPTFEGVYVPADDAEWRAHLGAQSPLNTTAGLSMPFWGLDVGTHTIT